MTQIQIEVKIKGGLDKLVQLLGSPGPLLRVIGLRLESYVAESFATAGRGKWVPLRPSTIETRGQLAKPLQFSGAYRRSWVVSTDDQTYVKVGSRDSKALWHEFGTGVNSPGGRGWYLIEPKVAKVLKFGSARNPRFAKFVKHPGVPARPVLPTKEGAEEIIKPVVDAMLEKAINADR